jgi:hypothetical protein
MQGGVGYSPEHPRYGSSDVLAWLIRAAVVVSEELAGAHRPADRVGYAPAKVAVRRQLVMMLKKTKKNPLETYFLDHKGREIHKWMHYFDIYHRHFRGTAGSQ